MLHSYNFSRSMIYPPFNEMDPASYPDCRAKQPIVNWLRMISPHSAPNHSSWRWPLPHPCLGKKSRYGTGRRFHTFSGHPAQTPSFLPLTKLFHRGTITRLQCGVFFSPSIQVLVSVPHASSELNHRSLASLCTIRFCASLV